MRVAYQGVAGAYSEAAAYNHFGGDVQVIPCNSFLDVFLQVQSGDSHYGVIPIENTLAGSVHQNYDLLLQHSIQVIGEEYLRIQHCLISFPGVGLEEIKKIISHPQALAQCDEYIKSLKGIQVKAVYNTAGSVKMVKDGGERSMAAIASRHAAEIYGMGILMEGIEDHPENYTRFLIIGTSQPPLEGDTKTSIVFSVPNTPGSLYKALGMFARRNIDLIKIESRPLVGKPWDYLFYIDLAGSSQEQVVEEALGELKELSLFLRILGAYPRRRI